MFESLNTAETGFDDGPAASKPCQHRTLFIKTQINSEVLWLILFGSS